MPDFDQTEARQILQNIDFWCQWDETFGEDANVLRQFFQERHDLLSSLFTHFLMVEAKCHKPGDDWWQHWQQLRTALPNEIARSFLLGLARRNEWYQCLSSQSVEWQYNLDGLLRETASDQEGRFTFELFLDADGHLRFARAIATDQKRGSEHLYKVYNQDTPAAIGYGSRAAKTYGWNQQVRMLQSCQRFANQNQYIDYDSISILNNGKRYDYLPSSSRTRVISHAACWALSEFKDQEVCNCLSRIALAYARKKSDSPDYHFPTSFFASPAYEMSNDSYHLSMVEMVAKYSEQEVRKLQIQSLYIEACWVQNDMTRIEAESRNETYYRTRSATWALERIGDDRAVTSLNYILDSTPNKWFRHMLRPTLDALAAKRGLSREDLADQLISTYDLDALGKRTYQFGGYQVSLTITSGGRLLRAIRDINGKECKNLPVKVRKEHEQIWRTIQSDGKELTAALSLQKARMEAAMIDGRSWSSIRWQSLFATHPILGHLARRLIWNICTPDGKHLAYALPEQDGSWRTTDNEILQIEEQSVLHLAHPIEMTPSEHTDWQRLIVARRIVQPFKQAFREIYTLTPAEEETACYSNRFAAQLVQLRPFNGAARGRGWTGTIAHASEGVAIGWRDYSGRNIRACFLHYYDSSRDHELLGVLGQVSFFPAGFHPNPHGMEYETALPLPEVEPVIFSEAMRDLDLFLSISSIGVDPEWQNREPAHERQERISREQGRMRAELLRELLPMLELTDRVRVEEHVALITGSYADYQVHLGSGNILLRPLGRYLCIIPRMLDEHLYLPFEENDGKTSEILSKILLLVHDEQITDSTILRQIRSKE